MENLENPKWNERGRGLFNEDNLVKTTKECTTQKVFEYREVENTGRLIFCLSDLAKGEIMGVKFFQSDGSSYLRCDYKEAVKAASK